MGVEIVTNLERDVVGPQQRDQQECGSHNGRTRCVAKENDGYPSNGTAIANETSKSKAKSVESEPVAMTAKRVQLVLHFQMTRNSQ